MKNTGYSPEQFAEIEKQIANSLQEKSLVPAGVDPKALANVLTQAAEHHRLPAHGATETMAAKDGGIVVFQPSSQDSALWPRTDSVRLNVNPSAELGDTARGTPGTSNGARTQEDAPAAQDIASSKGGLFTPDPKNPAPRPGTVGPGGASRFSDDAPDSAEQLASSKGGLFTPDPKNPAPRPGTVGPGGASRMMENPIETSGLVASSNGVLFTPDPRHPAPREGSVGPGGATRMMEEPTQQNPTVASADSVTASKPRMA